MPKNRFGRSVALLAGGTALGQVAAVLASPILTRLYTPADFGRYSLFLSFFGLAVVAVSLRYETAIVGCTSAEAPQLAFLSIIVGLFVTPFLAAGLYFCILFDIAGFGQIPYTFVAWAWVALMFSAVFWSLRYFLVRIGEFKLLSQVAVVQGWGRAIGQVGFGFLQLSVAGLVLGEIVGRCLGVGRMVRHSRKALSEGIKSLDWKNAPAILKRHRNFPLFILPSSLIDMLAVVLPIPLIASLYGLEAAGQFALVQRVIALPVGLIGGSVADVFHSEMASALRENSDRSRALMLQTAAKLTLIGSGMAVVLVSAGPPVFSLVFGETWSLAGDLARLMAPWFAAQLIVSPLSRVVFITNGQKLKLIYDLAATVAVFCSLYGGHLLGMDLPVAVGGLSALNVLAYGVYFFLLLRLVGSAKGGSTCAG